MRVTVERPSLFMVEFESAEELRAEYDANLSAGGICLPTEEKLPEFSPVELRMKLGGRETEVAAIVVRLMEGAMAFAIEAAPESIMESLTASMEAEGAPADQSQWDRLRGLSRTEKLLLAPKADRSERAVLVQDNDPQVLQSLLRNPRITGEEVVRVARSSLISAATADLIAKNTQWASNPEIRIALVHNPKTPTPLALRLLPLLPESEIKQIAKGAAVSQALRQAAIKLVINRK